MKRFKITPISLTLILLVFCSLTVGVYSYMFKNSDTISNEFVPASVNCEVVENTNNPVTLKTEVMIKSTSNIDVYVRLKFVSYWVNDNNEIVAKPSEMPKIQIDKDKWIGGSDNTYYYIDKISPNETTSNLLKLGTVIQLAEVDANGYKQVVEIFAEAIQADPISAAEQSWNIYINDSSKEIDSVNQNQ